MPTEHLWRFLIPGYICTIAVEAPILLLALSHLHPTGRRLLAGAWLTACTYPVVVLVLPVLLDAGRIRPLYLLAAETFAPVAECLLFSLAFHDGSAQSRWSRWRDYAAITAANLASFLIGEAAATHLVW